MPFKWLKNHIGNLATGFVSGKINNFLNSGSAKDSGKVSAQLLKKGPFDIPDSPSQKLKANPLQFNPVQYPLDLGSNELGHYILFESGFVGYSPQTSGFLEQQNNTQHLGVYTTTIHEGPAGRYSREVKTKAKWSGVTMPAGKITAKTPSHSITTSGIALYMPPDVKVNYTQQYDDNQETGLMGDIEKLGENVMSAETTANKIQAGLEGVIGVTARKAKTILGEFVGLAGQGDPVRFMAKRAGVAVNPRNESFYVSPNQREFSFTFDFWPRNAKEAEAVSKIIAIFKYNSSPGFAEKGMGSVFTIPNYWKISYMYNNGENPHLNKIGACYCKGVDVDYSPDGTWSTFGDGHPVHTKLVVNFVEDRIITKGDIEAGA